MRLDISIIQYAWIMVSDVQGFSERSSNERRSERRSKVVNRPWTTFKNFNSERAMNGVQEFREQFKWTDVHLFEYSVLWCAIFNDVNL